ncbi:hypothetical protein BDW71DRAFT_202127 [Aspergillus fruticulosus]
MSPDGTGCEGVTNPLGQVYTGHGTDVHRGLVCCDASIILTSLGVNPLGATITELAERSVALVAGQRGLKIDLETSNGDIDTDSRPRFSHPKGSQTEKNKDYVSTEWHFTESLEGYVAVPSLSASYAVAEHVGKGCSSTMRRIPTVEGVRDQSSFVQPSESLQALI